MSEIIVERFDQESWDRWEARGRASDVAFRHRVRMLALLVGSLGLLAASVWTLA